MLSFMGVNRIRLLENLGLCKGARGSEISLERNPLSLGRSSTFFMAAGQCIARDLKISVFFEEFTYCYMKSL